MTTSIKTNFDLKNDLKELEILADQVELFGNNIGLERKCIFQINLALDELFTNIVSYGFNDNTPHRIDFTLCYENDLLTITIVDDGKPFNPHTSKEPELDAPVEDRACGGLGIHLCKKMLDQIIYRRSGDKNILVLRKKPS